MSAIIFSFFTKAWVHASTWLWASQITRDMSGWCVKTCVMRWPSGEVLVIRGSDKQFDGFFSSSLDLIWRAFHCKMRCNSEQMQLSIILTHDKQLWAHEHDACHHTWMNVTAHAHKYTHTQKWDAMWMHLWKLTHMHKYIWNMHKYLCIYVYMSICIYVCMYICMYIYTNTSFHQKLSWEPQLLWRFLRTFSSWSFFIFRSMSLPDNHLGWSELGTSAPFSSFNASSSSSSSSCGASSSCSSSRTSSGSSSFSSFSPFSSEASCSFCLALAASKMCFGGEP